MKMKRTIKIALCAGVILAVAACFLLLRSKTVCGISEGTYRMVTEDGSGNAPAIHFDMSGEKIRFVFGMDPRMSFAYTGTVQLDGKVRLRADNAVNRFNRQIRRSSFVKTQIIPRDGGDYSVVMALDDEMGNLMTLELLAPNQRQAVRLGKLFEKKAEAVYNLTMAELLDDEDEADD